MTKRNAENVGKGIGLGATSAIAWRVDTVIIGVIIASSSLKEATMLAPIIAINLPEVRKITTRMSNHPCVIKSSRHSIEPKLNAMMKKVNHVSQFHNYLNLQKLNYEID